MTSPRGDSAPIDAPMTRQLSLFEGGRGARTPKQPVKIEAAPVTPDIRELARQLPAGVRLGTSSWHFPGWKDIVWSNTETPGDLARHGLAAYARHPLFGAVGLDRSFYAPLAARQYALYARQTPEHFRFVVKAPGVLTSPWLYGDGGTRGRENARFLDASCAVDQFVNAASEGLGERAGPLVFQFPPLGRTLTRAPERFIARLHEFLERLPRGPLYAVEMRDSRMITRRFFATLKETGVRYCVSVHPRMPPVAAQAAAMSGFGPGPLVVRWNLQSGYNYDEAKVRFSPFNRLIHEDSATRESIAQLCMATLAAGQECTIIANNKAEGSAPLTLVKLAQAIVTAARRRLHEAE